MIASLFPLRPVATVAINMRPVRTPWGGSSPFVAQLQQFLRRRGYRVQFHLRGQVDVIVIIDPREDLPFKAFGMAEIREYCRHAPATEVIHRVNECDQRKGTHHMDALLAQANQVATCTVFISEWMREYHTSRWFDQSRPHKVIYNGASAEIFHPIGSDTFAPSEPFRLVTHHWSDNPLKGFDVYEQVDALLAAGGLKGFEFWVIGRWPATIQWKAATLFAPCRGRELADLLRQCHCYLTASRWEPCGMHHVEGAQCGLPLLYHSDGGGIVEAGKKYGIEFRDNVAAALVEARDHYATLRHQVLEAMPSGDQMCLEYAIIIQRLACQGAAARAA